MNVTSSPWVSFCLATYCRQDLLRQTLRAISQQTMPDFEVIVSDNDPEASGRVIVEEMQDNRFKYFCNAENLGMIKNFNKALSKASGEFVVMITDDDPPYPEMLATLRSFQEDYPSYGAYYGACDVNIVNPDLAILYNASLGKNACLADLPTNFIRIFSSDEFPLAYFSNQIFPYVLWSAGIVRRQIALEIGGVPDYGSPYLGDFAYICLAGSYLGCATINISLGYQTVHDGNFGRKESKELKIALEGFHEYMSQRLSHRQDWDPIRLKLEMFLGNWIVAHSLFLKKYFRFYRIDNKDLNNVLYEIFQIPYMRPLMWEYLKKQYTPDFIVKVKIKLYKLLSPLKKSLKKFYKNE